MPIFIFFKGMLTLILEEPIVEPAIDIYRVEIENKLYVDFNASMAWITH